MAPVQLHLGMGTGQRGFKSPSTLQDTSCKLDFANAVSPERQDQNCLQMVSANLIGQNISSGLSKEEKGYSGRTLDELS